jgi:type I restriction enzyme S subunit
MSFMEKLLDGVEVEWKALAEVFDILAGGDVPKEALSDIETEEFNVPILSNGIGGKSLYAIVVILFFAGAKFGAKFGG